MRNSKRLLYISVAPINFNQLDGVAKKIIDQSNAFLQLGLDTNILYRDNETIALFKCKDKAVLKLGKGKNLLPVLSMAKKICRNYDYVYIRYPMSNLHFMLLLRKLHHLNIPTVVEIPTFPYDSEGINTLKGKVVMLMDKFFRMYLKKYLNRICTYSNDSYIFGIHTINTINGIDFSRFTPDVTPLDSNVIQLIAVSSMFKVHGYERLICGLHDYYHSGGTRNIIFNIIGSGEEELKYKALVKAMSLTDHVIFWGKQFGDDLRKLYKLQALGVNSLAIHRQGLKSESTLKTKEYAAMGLPIISSSFVDSFSKVGNDKYVFRIPSDESNVNIAQLIEFIDELYASNNIHGIRNEIRSEGYRHCDMVNTLRPIVDYYFSF